MRKAATSLAVLAAAGFTCAGSASAGTVGRPRAPARVRRDLPAPVLPVTGASLSWPGADTPLWSVHGNREMAIASTTKLMTTLVVLQHVHDLSTVYAQNDWRPKPVDSQLGLVPDERMTVHDLLVAMLVPSADDAAEDLAYNVGHGSVQRFLAMMNADARALGLRHTHYTTPSGLDTPGNYSTPDDLVRLAEYMMRDWPFFRRTVRLRSAVLHSGLHVRHVVNTDDLLGRIRWIQGIKTGYTTRAGYVLISQGRRDGFTLVASVLGTRSEALRDSSALRLLDWGFAEYRLAQPVRRGERFATRTVAGESAPVSIVAARGYRTVVRRSARIRTVVGSLRRLEGPMAKGTIVGHLRVLITGRRAVSVPLALARRLPRVSLQTKLGHVVTRPFTLLVIALLLGIAVAAGRRPRRRPPVVALRRVEER